MGKDKLTEPTETEVHGPLHHLCKCTKEHFKLNADFPLFLRRQLGSLLPLPNDVTSENANSDTHKT